MKKYILTIGVLASLYTTKAQEIMNDINAIENIAPIPAVNEGRLGLHSSLTDLIGGLNPKALTSGTSAASLLTNLSTVTSTGGNYGEVLQLLSGSLSKTSFLPSWTKLKGSFANNTAKAKSSLEVANLAGQLVKNLKPSAFTSSFNKTEFLSSLTKIK